MKIILQEKIENLGEAFSVVKVKAGYARNYLIPKKLAFVASPGNLNRIDFLKKQQARTLEKVHAKSMEIAKSLEEISVTIAVKVGEDEKMYGSVTAQQIYNRLKKEGIENISKKMIVLEEPIKSLGIYNIPLKLDAEVNATLKVWVVKE
ncbi:MAG: 50S ribosomal protein L9 [bacterium]